MSKKNLSLLMDGFMGEANQSEAIQEPSKEQAVEQVAEQAEQPAVQIDKQEKPKVTSSKSTTKEETTETETTDKMKSKRRENVGRPKKGETAKSAKKPQEIRATFIVDPDLLQKVKYISLVEGALLKDVISEALNNYVGKWETDNRKIRLPKRK